MKYITLFKQYSIEKTISAFFEKLMLRKELELGIIIA